MLRATIRTVAALSLAFAAAQPIQAQEWRPPTHQMPAMPSIAELSGDWLDARAAWFAGVEGISGVAPSQLRAVGEAPGGSAARVVRFNHGPVPAVVWQDRNGDGKCDMVEIYRGGGVVVQAIDADYDGSADVVRVYDANGRLVREDRL